jgi:cytochrome c-type biogenesis protein CcmH/NrfG
MTQLWVSEGVLLLIALAIVIYACKPARLTTTLTVLICFAVTGISMNYYWGEHRALEQIAFDRAQAANVKQAMKQFSSPQQVIDKMRTHLEQDPSNPKGWYLLGKLYISQRQFNLAEQDFEKSYHLDPKSLATRIEYVQASYVINGEKLVGLADKILQQIIKEDPNQVDALNILAIDAYTHKKYQVATKFWQKILLSLPEGTKERQTIEKAIAMAQDKENLHE